MARQISIEEMTTSQKIAIYLDLKAKAAEIKTQMSNLEDSIKAGMGDLNEVRENGFVARIECGTQRKFDTTRFKAEHLDVYESYRHDVPTTSFKVYVEG